VNEKKPLLVPIIYTINQGTRNADCVNVFLIQMMLIAFVAQHGSEPDREVKEHVSEADFPWKINLEAK
jgi:hypothetical protein